MTRRLPFLIAAAALALPTAPAHAQQRTEVGQAASVVGEVEVSQGQNGRPRAVALHQRLSWGEMIRTGAQSQVQLLLLDRSSFGVGPRSRVMIDRFVYDPNASRSLTATLIQGALRFFSGQQASGNSADVTTPSGRIGIRGTAIDMLVGEDAKSIARDEAAVGGGNNASDDEATLVVLRGPGPGAAGRLTPGLAEVTAAGVTVRLDQPGQAAFIPRNGAPPIGPFQISDAGLGRVIDQLARSVARANDGSVLGDILPVAAGLAVVAVGVIVATDGDDGGQTVTAPNGPTDGPVSSVPNSTTSVPGVPSGQNGPGPSN